MMLSPGGEKPQDTAYQEALATKRIEFIQSLKGQLSVENSVADQTVALYSMLLEGKKYHVDDCASCHTLSWHLSGLCACRNTSG